MYKLLVLDLDGTLTNKKKEITPHTLQVLKEAQQKGLKIVLASGRPTYGIVPLAEQLELKHFGGYIMAFNGGLILDCATGETIYQNFLDPSVYPYLYEKGNTKDFKILSYKDEYIVSEDIANEYVAYEARLNKMPLMQVENFLDVITFPEPKCLIVGNPEILKDLEVEMREKLQNCMSVYRSEPFFLELLPLGIDKAKCLEKLLERMQIDRKNVIACGDGFNDLSMIEYAGLGVAMANAQQVVKNAADYITLSNEEDGVAAVVEKFFFKKENHTQA
jgi:Cof subfamily protein (haloacid dehalogenase superfamily)